MAQPRNSFTGHSSIGKTWSQKKINIFLSTFSIISDEHLANAENSVRFVIHALGPFPQHNLFLWRDYAALERQVRTECDKMLRYVLITAWGNCNEIRGICTNRSEYTRFLYLESVLEYANDQNVVRCNHYPSRKYSKQLLMHIPLTVVNVTDI